MSLVYQGEDKICGNCKYFYQHYIRSTIETESIQFYPTEAGHCTEPRLKNRTPATKACAAFEYKQRRESIYTFELARA